MRRSPSRAATWWWARWSTRSRSACRSGDISGKAIANLATEELTHPAPVFHGDTLYAESEVLEVRPSQSKPDRGIVKVRTDVYNQRNELVATFRRAVLIPQAPRRAEPASAKLSGRRCGRMARHRHDEIRSLMQFE